MKNLKKNLKDCLQKRKYRDVEIMIFRIESVSFFVSIVEFYHFQKSSFGVWRVNYILRIITYNLVIGHTKPKAPDPIRTPKLSGLRHG